MRKIKNCITNPIRWDVLFSAIHPFLFVGEVFSLYVCRLHDINVCFNVGNEKLIAD